MEPLLSIIVPAFNIENYISRCLESLINQNYKNIEIIVVDDGSKDKTGEIIDDYAKQDYRIKFIHKKNEGVSIARNTGIDIAKGDYIGFVDGDDTVDKEMFEILIKNAVDYNADISHCGYKMVFPSRIDYYYNTENIIIQNNYDGLEGLLKADKIEPGLWNKIYKANLFNDFRLNPNIKYNEDLLANFYLFKRSKKSVFYDKCMYNYLIRKGSAATKEISPNKLIDPILVIKEIKGYLEKDYELYDIAYRRYLTGLVGICRNTQCRNDKYFSDYIKESKKILKRELYNINNKHLIRGKLKYMVYGVVYMPIIFNCIDDIYSVISGNKYKYKVE
ncbi:glycosyltransferase [Terrisporobacter petrolearius]|uniref:glycosyltransferase n=1 Tax=Terrisporobacter petrolearius TaxID=1460447 RepID=UPI0031CCA4C2